MHRRVLVMALLAWTPLLLLSMAEGSAWGGSVALTFLQDIETHVRLLIAVPLLILAEAKAHQRLRLIVRSFVERELIPDAARPQFDAAVASALRWRDSAAAEFLMIVFVYTAGVVLWRTQVALDVTSWYATAEGGRLQLTHAGWWAALVSMPVIQFLLVRWYYRLFIWARLLWQVSRIDLNLQPTHPDGAAGLRFLSMTGRAFTLLLLALGTILAGMVANRIFYAGAKLLEFKPELFGTAALLVLVVLGPLLVFTPQLRATRRKGMAEYGRLGQHYAREFNRKWLRADCPPAEQLLGNADFQSLADLHNGFQVVMGIKWAPVGMSNVTTSAATVLLPVAPLLLTTFSVEQLLDRVLKVLF